MASKDILWEGTWTYPDGRRLTVTERDLHNAANQGNRMLASGLVVPWCWDHQPGVTPAPVEMSLSVLGDPNVRAKVARNTIPAATTRLRVEEKVRPDGKKRKVLVAEFDDSRLSAGEKKGMADAGRVSCRVARNLWDARGNGRVYKGLVVQHIAVTPSAIEPDQGEFEMSLAAMPELARGKCDESWDMAAGKYDGDEEEGEEEIAEMEGDGALADTAEGEDPLADVPGPPLPPPAPVVPPPPPGPPPEMQVILQSLSAMGLPLPTDQITDLSQLAMALKIAAGLGGQLKGAPGAGDPDADLTATAGVQPGQGPPMLMSQAAMLTRAPDTVARDRANVRAKIDRLHRRGKIPGPTYDALVREHGTFEMSYTAGGRLHKGGLIRDLAVLDRYLPEGMFGRKSAGEQYDMAVAGMNADGIAPVNPPAVYRDADGLTKLEDLMEESFKKFGVPPKAA